MQVGVPYIYYKPELEHSGLNLQNMLTHYSNSDITDKPAKPEPISRHRPRGQLKDVLKQK